MLLSILIDQRISDEILSELSAIKFNQVISRRSLPTSLGSPSSFPAWQYSGMFILHPNWPEAEIQDLTASGIYRRVRAEVLDDYIAQLLRLPFFV